MRLGAQPFLWKWVLFEWEWKMIPYQRLCTYPRFETEARVNSEMAYSLGINSMSAIEWPGWLKWEGTAAVVFAWSFFCCCCCLSMFFKAFTKCAFSFTYTSCKYIFYPFYIGSYNLCQVSWVTSNAMFNLSCFSCFGENVWFFSRVNVWAGEAAISGVAAECASRGLGCAVVVGEFRLLCKADLSF